MVGILSLFFISSRDAIVVNENINIMIKFDQDKLLLEIDSHIFFFAGTWFRKTLTRCASVVPARERGCGFGEDLYVRQL